MKRLLALFVFVGLTTTAMAVLERDQALLSEDDTWNLYTKLAPSMSDLGSDSGIWGTLEIGSILNEAFAVGLRATTLLDDANPGFDGYSEIQHFDATFAGVNLEYTLFARKLLHGSFGFFAGLGTMKLSGGDDTDVDLTVFEPTLNLMVNVSQDSEFGLGLGYRYMDPSGAEGLSDSDLSGLAVTFFLRLTEY